MSKLRRKAIGEKVNQDRRPLDESWKGILFDNKYFCRTCHHIMHRLEIQDTRQWRYLRADNCLYCGDKSMIQVGPGYNVTGYVDPKD